MNFVVTRGWIKAALVAVAISVWTSQDVAQDRPTFEVASVKPAAPDAVPRNQIVPTNPGRLHIPSMTLSWLIHTAYGDGCPSGYLPGRLFLDGATMFSLAEALSLPQARALVGGITGDRTGLTGRYTLVLDYDFSPRRPADPSAPADVPRQPSLGTAVKEQLGLRFEQGPAPFRLVTVESAQPPVAN